MPRGVWLAQLDADFCVLLFGDQTERTIGVEGIRPLPLSIPRHTGLFKVKSSACRIQIYYTIKRHKSQVKKSVLRRSLANFHRQIST